jgi:hypothetical protein
MTEMGASRPSKAAYWTPALAQSCSGSPLLVLPQVSVERTFVPWLPIIAEGKHSYDLEYQLPTEAP